MFPLIYATKEITCIKKIPLFSHINHNISELGTTNSLIKSGQIANVRGISYLYASGRIACKLFVRVRMNSPQAICLGPDK